MLQPIELRDLQRLAAGESPDFPSALLAFLAQPEDALEEPELDGSSLKNFLKSLTAAGNKATTQRIARMQA